MRRIIKRKRLIIFTLLITIFTALGLNFKTGFAASNYTLLTGTQFNMKLKSLVAGTNVSSYATEDDILEKVVFDRYDEEKYGTSGSIASFAWQDGIRVDDLGYIKIFYDSANHTAYVLVTGNSSINFNKTSYYMFMSFKKINTIEFGNVINTSNVNNFFGMFRDCQSLTTIDLSNFDTSNVTDISQLFYDCKSLTNLNLGDLDTSNVTNMSYMFYNCQSLTMLELSNFDTSNVTTMASMFNGCSSLTSLDLSNFNTSNVTDMKWMFEKNTSLISLNLSSFDTSNVTSMYNLFSDDNSLTNLDLSSFDTSNVTNMSNMFKNCSNLTGLDLSNFDTSGVTGMSAMFYGCSNLTSLDLSSFNTSQVTTMSYMFYECNKLKTIYISEYDINNNSGWILGNLAAQNGGYNMFKYCDSLIGGYGTSFEKIGSIDSTYAVIDSPTQQGYLTLKQEYTHDLNSSYILESNENLIINFNQKIHYITDIYLTIGDNAINLEENIQYTIVDGNLVFDSSYLNLLELGDYKLHVKNKDSAEENIIDLKITKKIIAQPENTEEDKNNNQDVLIDNEVDTFDNIKSYITLFIVSLISFIYLSFFIIKKNNTEKI